MQTNASAPLGLCLGTFGTARISVVIPAFNAGDYLRATLESVYAQSAPPGEIIVVDDGSTDDTVAVAQACGATVISLENRGQSAARNAGTLAANGEYVAYLDADDIWPPDKLALQFAALTSYREPAFSFTDYRRFDTLGMHLGRSGLRAHPAFRRTVGNLCGREIIFIAADERHPVLSDMYFLPSSALVRRSDALAVGGFDETLRTGEDHEFFLRLFRRVPAIAVMRPLLLYRRHATQVSATGSIISLAEFQIQKRISAAPDRYPSADARYLLGKGFLLHYRIGVCAARLGEFDAAIDRFKQSLAARHTVRAAAALAATRVAQSAAGRCAFNVVRALRRMLPQRRSAGAELYQTRNIARS